eukprot:TRINITY_DN6628_c1_g1_i1.p2 TRINITY_DN6628_c1_g1~~TRINITY_DN6628_c1_g1_i1.p2  ORF type:complete len:189 (+),score=68.08 TRINITY_DN6628_c1_g1_i1:221-787(+)
MRFAPSESEEQTAEPPSRKVHRWLLEAGSDKLRAMFRAPMQEATSGVITTDHELDEPMQCLIKFLYGEPLPAELGTAVVCELARLADEYLVDDLTTFCENFLLRHLDRDSAVELLLAASRLSGFHDLRTAARDFIARDFDEISNTDQFIFQLTQEQGGKLLQEVLIEKAALAKKRKRNRESDTGSANA